MKRVTRVLALSGLCLSLAGVAIAQQSERPKGIPGYYNPKTHTFQAKISPLADPDATTAKTYTGTLKFEFTVKLVTAIPSGSELFCEATAEAGDSNFYTEAGAIKATVSGSTATCTVPIPYSWSLVDASTDQITLGYDLSILPTSTTSVAIEYPTRESSGSVPSKAIPTVGATTVVTVSATI